MLISRYAYNKVREMTKHSTEVAAFCLTPNDPLLIEDIYIPEQTATSASFSIDADAMASATFELIDQGFELHQFSRIMIHTHPGNSNTPSGVDWDNYNEYYKDKDFAAMLIMSKDGRMSCHASGKIGALDRQVKIDMGISIYDEHSNNLADEVKALIEANVKDEYVTRSNRFQRFSTKTPLIDYYEADEVTGYYGANSDSLGNDEPPVSAEAKEVLCGGMTRIPSKAVEKHHTQLAKTVKGLKPAFIARLLQICCNNNNDFKTACRYIAYLFAFSGEISGFDIDQCYYERPTVEGSK